MQPFLFNSCFMLPILFRTLSFFTNAGIFLLIEFYSSSPLYCSITISSTLMLVFLPSK